MAMGIDRAELFKEDGKYYLRLLLEVGEDGSSVKMYIPKLALEMERWFIDLGMAQVYPKMAFDMIPEEIDELHGGKSKFLLDTRPNKSMTEDKK